MKRQSAQWVLVPLILLGGTAAVAGPRSKSAPRPPVDRQAMAEAIKASRGPDEGFFSSSSSYAHFLRSQLAHNVGDHRRAADELRLALASTPDSPFLLTALAEQYARLGDVTRAERELRKVIERRPSYYPAQLLMGRLLLEMQKYTRAKLHLHRAIKLSPQAPDPYLTLAQLWIEQGRSEEAVRTIDELSLALPGEPSGYRKLGMVLLEREDLPRAEQMLLKASERDPGDFDTWVALSQIYEASDRLELAEDALGRALERDPENREVMLAAGRLALRQGSTVRARAYFEQLLSVSQDPELAVKVAFSYWATKQIPEAAAVLDSARAAGLREPRIHFYSGLVNEQLNRYAKAAEAYSAIGPEAGEIFHEARLHRAICLSQLNQHKSALQLFKAGLAEKPDYAALVPAYARALERAGKPQEAEAVLTRAIASRPSPELFEVLSEMLERRGRLADAIEILTEALARQPRDEALLYTLGTAYERKGEFALAIEKMRAVLALNPDHALAMNFIAYSLANRGRDLDEAERLVLRALELRPDNGPFLDSLGWVYYRRGDYHQALKTLERAAELMPGEPTVNEHLGDVYVHLLQTAQARDAYLRALDGLKASPELAETKNQRVQLEQKLKKLSSGRNGR